MQTILISGGSGLIGSDLKKYFTQFGYSVRILTRKPTQKNKNAFYWNLEDKTIDSDAFENVEIVINLAGSSIIGGRWTKSRKKELTHSRVNATKLLIDTINDKKLPIKQFIQASAMGYYGNSNESMLTE
jgi:NAD dependent epimerase/dehydratase family enzyme